VKILCWNMAAAYGRWRDEPELHERAWHWVAAVDPDLAFLQEVRPPAWVADRWKLVIEPFKFFASAVLARSTSHLQPVEMAPGGVLSCLGSYLATAGLALSDGSRLLVSSVHTSAREAPAWGHPNLDRASIARAAVGQPWWNDIAFAGYRELVTGHRFLVAGDWNTSRYRDEDGIAIPAGAEFFDRAATAGWVDISLDEGGGEVKTWYGFETSRPHQADHAFADAETAALVRRFAVDPWPVVELGLSDHAPLLFDVDLEAAVLIRDPAEPVRV
jgi:endonuclease/exonuclease/phosphatase family metal-dependent hydrolase